MITDKVLWLQGGVTTLAGAIAPIVAGWKVPHDIPLMILGGVLGGCVALGAWLSTSFALSPNQVAKRITASKADRAE